jgi:hypothetical protein
LVGDTRLGGDGEGARSGWGSGATSSSETGLGSSAGTEGGGLCTTRALDDGTGIPPCLARGGRVVGAGGGVGATSLGSGSVRKALEGRASSAVFARLRWASFSRSMVDALAAECDRGAGGCWNVGKAGLCSSTLGTGACAFVRGRANNRKSASLNSGAGEAEFRSVDPALRPCDSGSGYSIGGLARGGFVVDVNGSMLDLDRSMTETARVGNGGGSSRTGSGLSESGERDTSTSGASGLGRSSLDMALSVDEVVEAALLVLAGGAAVD